jgi:osmoprotectant transport system ATP-binding protein
MDHVTKRYTQGGAASVDDLSIAVPEGTTTALIGPSGCGKTTTMRMINRLIDPTEGKIIVNGEDVTKVDPVNLRRHIGYVIQQVGLFPHMTIAQNIAAVPKLLGWAEAKIKSRTEELLHLVGLDPREMLKRYPRQLSGGQRQRIGVARALAADPPVLLMDEPFGALDPLTRAEMRREFQRIQSQVRKTVVCVTHDMGEAFSLGTKVGVLAGGKLAACATPAEIIRSNSPEVKIFLDALPKIEI